MFFLGFRVWEFTVRGFRVEGFGAFRVWGLGFTAWRLRVLGLTVWGFGGIGFGMQGLVCWSFRFRLWVSGFRVQGFGCGSSGSDLFTSCSFSGTLETKTLNPKPRRLGGDFSCKSTCFSLAFC